MLIALSILIMVGICWTATGIVMGGSARHHISVPLMQFISYAFGTLVCVMLFHAYPKLSVSPTLLWYALGMYFIVGILNFFLNEAMSRAMAIGPNSLVWAILQSGMLIPFTIGILVHDVPAGFLRLLGMAMLLSALGLMSMGRKEEPGKIIKGNTWIWVSLVAFLICGTQQSVNNEPSYNDNIRTGIPVVYRCAVIYFGNMLAAGMSLFKNGIPGFRQCIHDYISNRYVWGYAIGLQTVNLITGLFLSFNGMDRMAKLNMGAVSYPVMVVTCIAGFTVYSIVFLKEKLTWKSALGLCFCIGGIVCISLG